MSYEKPQISDYGTLAELTAATKTGNTPDGSFTLPPNSGALLTCDPSDPTPCITIP